MSVFTGPRIEQLVARGDLVQHYYENWDRTLQWVQRPDMLDPFISITPFDAKNCGPNSYDVHLGDTLLFYDVQNSCHIGVIDPKNPPKTYSIKIPESGWRIEPGTLYLGSTVERTRCAGCVPWIDGRSSIGRLGINVHVTAGRGDDGFGMDVPEGSSWTLEIHCVQPAILYAGMKIAQLTFMSIEGQRNPYKGRYAHQGAEPQPSKYHEDEPPFDRQ